MSAAPTPTLTRSQARSRAVPSGARLSFFRVLRSEVVKLTTLRSTWWSLGITVVLAVGIALAIAAASSSLPGGIPPVVAITAPMQFTMMVAGIFGAIAITGEYSTGMIRSTLTAEPRRGVVLVAKVIAVAAFLIVTALISTTISILVTAPIFGDNSLDWGDAAASSTPLAFSLLAMACFGLIGLGWGFIIRNSAGAIAATVGVLFVAPIMLSLFTIGGESWAWLVDLSRYLPMSAASTLTTPDPADLGTAVITMLAWPAATLLGGWLVLRTRDA